MYNLRQGIKEDGIAIGVAREKVQIILNMYKNGFTAEQIASATDKDIEEVNAIIVGKENELALAQKIFDANEKPLSLNNLKAFVILEILKLDGYLELGDN